VHRKVPGVTLILANKSAKLKQSLHKLILFGGL